MNSKKRVTSGGPPLRVARESSEVIPSYPYVWRAKTRPIIRTGAEWKIAPRFGERCRVVTRGALNSAEIEFEDGYRVISSRNYLRKA